MSFLADPNGDVWVGTTQGMVHFDAAAYRALPPSKPPAVSFITLRLGQQPYETKRADIEVPYRANTFEVRFAGISFTSEDNLQYRERLLGQESDFHVANSHDARYSALSHGHYRFEVSARRGEHGPWGPPAVFDFTVLPAWWDTWWFRTLGAFVGMALLLRFVRWRLHILQRDNRLLEDAVAARTGELIHANDCLSETNTLLQSEIDDRLAAEHALHQRNDDLDTLNSKLAGTQSQLLQSEKMASVGQLAAGVAHEINNPIGYVNSNLGILRRYMGDMYTVLDRYAQLEQALPADHPSRVDLAALKARVEMDYLREDAPHLLQESEDGIVRVLKIVRDLRDFSRLDEYEWQLADLHQGLESTLSIVANEIKYKAELIREYGELPQIECLPSQLNQVFLNLLINAAQSIPERGRITIRTGTDARGVWVQFSDTGQGIKPANLGRIFEPFFTTKPIGTGTGLGLSVSYGIVQTHGGTIDVDSELGVGTSFTVHLPIHGSKPSAEQKPPTRATLLESAAVGG
jgi:signal transduction histidine kinase